MKAKSKIALFAAALAAAFLWSGSAKADYWSRHTRSTSSDALPEHFELENMAKSSNGVRFMYGNDRVDMSDQNSFVRYIVKYDGTNWSDETATVKSMGYGDIEFLNMYADAHGNVWMPNRKDPDVALMKYGSDGSWTRMSSSWMGTATGIGGNVKVKNLFGNRNDTNLMYAVATNDTRLYVLIYNFSTATWSNSGYTGSPLLDSNNNGADFWGLYNEDDDSFWFYQYHSSENEYSNPSGGDVGIGIWKYKGGSWTQYDSSDTTSDGVSLRNGVTDAFIDTSGNVWVGTRYGVFRYELSSGNWQNWTKDNSNIFTNRVIKIQEDADGRVWIIALEDENVAEDNGGISIYNNSTAEWDYYTSYNGEDALSNATNIFMIGGDEAWMFTGHGESAMQAGIYQLVRDDSHTALYGQTSGATVEKASLGVLRRSSAKKVSIWKKYRVQKKNGRYKWKKIKVYSGRTSTGWYKKLNLDAGENIKYIIKVQGRKQRTIDASTGDPIRVNFN